MSSLSKSLKSFAAFRAGAPTLFRAFAANERRDRRSLAALQVERLKSLLVHASESATFWRRRFARYGIRPEQLRSVGELAVLPLLEERDRRDYGRELLVDGEPDPTWLEVTALDPATASPLWLEPRTRRERQVDELRHVGWTGLDWRTPRAELTGRAEDGGVLPRAGGTLRAALRGGLWLHPLRVPADAATFAARATKAGAELLSGPPSALLAFAAAGGGEAFRPRAIQSFGECLSEERRERIQEAFDARVHDAWRTRELGEAAHECEAQNGLHVTMERVLIEIVRDGQPVPDGEEGEIVATALDGRAQALLRWRTGDVGCRIPEPTCSCGRTSERILVTDGRIGALVTSPGGTRIHGDWFDWLFGSIPGIAGGRVVQDRAGALVVEIVAVGPWDEAQATALRAALHQVDPAFVVEVRRVATLPESPDGRRRTVVSAAPLTWHAPEPEPVVAGRRG